MIEYRPAQRIWYVGDGVQITHPRGAAAADWWDPTGAGLAVIGAWQAKSAANFAASLVDLSGSGNNATDPGGANTPAWDAVNGWAGGYLDTGLFPTQAWTLIVQFTSASGFGSCCGVATAGQRIALVPNNGANRTYFYGAGGRNVVGAAINGNMCVAGGNYYLNGAVDAAPQAAAFVCVGNARLVTAFGGFGYTGNVQAVALYNATLTAPQVAAVAAAMAAL